MEETKLMTLVSKPKRNDWLVFFVRLSSVSISEQVQFTQDTEVDLHTLLHKIIADHAYLKTLIYKSNNRLGLIPPSF